MNRFNNTLDQFYTTVRQMPCAGIRVVAMDADPLWDEYCGAAYTDSRGIAVFGAECGDAINSDPEVYAKVEGRSINGFSVGVLDSNLWQRIRDSTLASLTGGATMPLYVVNALREHRTFEWLSPESQVTTSSIDFGDVQIGGSTADGTVSTMAARQFWAAQYTMFRLNAGTRYRPMDFNYTVSGPIFPVPVFTAYDTVMVAFTETASPSAALRATSHEIGHVLYNTYHSGMLHWLYEDVTDYMTTHRQCDIDHFQTLAWYEGFANFIQDYFEQVWDWTRGTWDGAVGTNPFEGCARSRIPGIQGMHVEGNVQAMLNNIFFGPVNVAQQIARGPTRPNEFTCAAGQTRIVNAAGVVQCQREVPATCATGGTMSVDHASDMDRCIQSVRDPRCPRSAAECEPVEQAFGTSCASGSPVRRPGPDICVVTSPAVHTLGGTPQPRPDGSPDMTIGFDNAGARAWFTLPDLDDVMDWVSAAGSDGHRAREYWDGRIRPWCLVPDGTRSRYCNPNRSSTFLGELRSLDPGLN